MAYPKEESEKPALIHVRVSGNCQHVHHVDISGLTEAEASAMRSALGGHAWVRAVNGRLEKRSAYEPLPSPTQDEQMLPFWRPHNPQAPGAQFEFLLHVSEPLDAHQVMPAITIRHLCGYHYTPERYKWEAEKLEGYGFECMRSRRGPDGTYWEIWYLPGEFAAKGGLRDAIRSSKKKLDDALAFLRRNCSFGTCDVSTQRMAMVIDD